MRYAKEQRLAWVLAHEEGKLDRSMTPEGVEWIAFRHRVSAWARIYARFGEDALETSSWRRYPKEFKLGAVIRVEAGESMCSVSESFMMKNHSIVQRWVSAYRQHGPDGLESKPKGRRANGMPKKKHKPTRDGELEYLRTENAYLKKLLELEQKAAESSSSKQKPSKPSGEKGTD